jgi:hypothetical protein
MNKKTQNCEINTFVVFNIYTKLRILYRKHKPNNSYIIRNKGVILGGKAKEFRLRTSQT